ncbi:MAG TPA: hypothetical protein VM345_20145 [Acidimicrobiales bacterium]|jgi:hypothetical protein|nr:hypothetical protein [Acidimicrobiales bacterium]
MLGTRHRVDVIDLTAWGGRDRAAKVAAAAATIAHGWDRLPPAELARLSEALDDHSRSYLEWIADLHGPAIHDLRGIIAAIRAANTLLRGYDDEAVRARLSATLSRSVTRLVDAIDEVGRTVDLVDA